MLIQRLLQTRCPDVIQKETCTAILNACSPKSKLTQRFRRPARMAHSSAQAILCASTMFSWHLCTWTRSLHPFILDSSAQHIVQYVFFISTILQGLTRHIARHPPPDVVRSHYLEIAWVTLSSSSVVTDGFPIVI